MSAREIELQKLQRYKAQAKRQLDDSNDEFLRYKKPCQAHAPGPAAQGPAAQGPRVPVPAASLPTVQKPVWNCTRVRQVDAYPDSTRHIYRVGSVMEITAKVPEHLAQYIGCVCRIENILKFDISATGSLMAMIVDFESITHAAAAEMAAVQDSHLRLQTKQALLAHDITIRPGQLLIALQRFLKPYIPGTPPTRQQYQDVFDLLLDADKTLDAIEQLTAMQQTNAGKQPVPNEQAPDSDDDSDDEEPGRLGIDDDSTY